MPDSAPDARSARRATAWPWGVGGRLIFAFVGVTAFAALAAFAGIYATQQIGRQLESVEERAAPTLIALDLARSAERIIAAAPALLATDARERRDEVKARLSADIARLEGALAELERNEQQALPLVDLKPTVAALTDNLAELATFADRRLKISEKLDALRQRLFLISEEVQRLLAPWLTVVDGEIELLVAEPANDANRADLVASLNLQRRIEDVQRRISDVGDMLAEASTTRQSDRLPVLAFQLRLGLDNVEQIATGLPPDLHALLLDRIKALRQLASGPDAVTEARALELGLLEEGRARLAAVEQLSAELTAAVDRLGHAAKAEIEGAIGDALVVQSLSGRVLIAIAGLSFLTAILIVWRYVGRSIVRRLNRLSAATRAIAGGRVERPVVAEGDDEIAEMSRAVEIFRQNAIELQKLLEERRIAAIELERVVAERTRDLSESLRQQEEQGRELESANTFKSRFLAAASHDLRQPLHALNLFVAQLIGGRDPNERAQTIAYIDATVGSMNDLLNNLLDMSKLEAGQLEQNVATFPVQDLLNRLESTFANAARARNLRFTVVPSSAWVESDPVLLERILLNLTSNALQYTNDGGILVGCRRRRGNLRIDVCDTGPGLSDAQQRSAFDEFVQLEVGGRRGGLGLGLTIVDRLARLLGHDIDLASQVGTGSRFSIAVPLAEAQSGTVRDPLEAGADPLLDKVIVVIEDDAMVLKGMRDILDRWGGRVIAASSESGARAALAALHVEPDLIISDVHLAGGAMGIDAIRNLRAAAEKAVPALLISGDTSPERQQEAKADGLELLHKPISPMRLRAVINHTLRKEIQSAPTLSQD